MTDRISNYFGSMHFKAKLILIIMTVAGCCLLFTVSSLAIYSEGQARKQLEDDLSVISQLIANRSTAAVAFQDSRLANENLNSLSVKKSVVEAYLFNESGEMMAAYAASGKSAAKKDFRGHHDDCTFYDNFFEIRKPIVLEGRTIGSVYIYASLDDLKSLRRSIIFVGTLIFLLGAVIAFLLSSRLQRIVSGPILALAGFMKKVNESGDYSTKASIISKDETGTLISVFNEMLELIDSQNSANKKLIDELKRSSEELQHRTRELQESTDKLNSIFDSIPQGIYWKNRDSVYLGCNTSFARMAGFDNPSQIVGMTDNAMPWQNYANAYIEEDHSLLKSPSSRIKKAEITCIANGREIWIEKTKSSICDHEGNVIIIMGIVDDISERISNEEKIRQLNEELEERVQKRTEQLENANKELEAFSYSVSHDLRAPLRHTSGFVELLKKRCGSELSDKAIYYLNTISDSVHLMGVLIDDLLKFSRTGRVEMNETDVNMSHLLDEVKELFVHEISSRNIEWSLGKLPIVSCDYSLIKIVWMNLLNNALKYTRVRKTAIIEIGCIQNGEEYIFHISDNGIGFDMQYAQNLFGVFQRMHSNSDYEGSGIGLANVRRIVMRHAGRVWAESEIEKGAKFYFTLPRNKEEIR